MAPLILINSDVEDWGSLVETQICRALILAQARLYGLGVRNLAALFERVCVAALPPAFGSTESAFQRQGPAICIPSTSRPPQGILRQAAL